MIRKESKFQTRFGRWVHYKWPKHVNAHFELKVARKGSLPFSAVSDKQKTNLRVAKKSHFVKYSDYDRLGTDFDCTFTGPAECYVVIQYDKLKQKEFFICPIDVFLNEEATSDRKSLKENRAREMCRVESFP